MSFNGTRGKATVVSELDEVFDKFITECQILNECLIKRKTLNHMKNELERAQKLESIKFKIV